MTRRAIPAKAVTGYNSLVDQGVAAIIGDVTTGPDRRGRASSPRRTTCP